MTKYLLSNQVKMYPSAYRRAENDVEANFTSENNVTKSNTLGFNHKSFVEENVDSLTIVCKGYRFEVSKNEVVALFDDNDNSPDAIYVGIRTIYKDAPHSAFNSLVNFADATNELDYATEFQGLAFSDTYSNDFYLQILEKDGTSYKVPDKSKLILSSNQIESSIGKSISQEFSTGKLTASDDITFTKIKTTTGTKAVIIDSSGKLSSTDNSSSYTRTADSGNNIKVLGSITQNTNGKITNYSETDLPLADTTIAGLVSTSTQSFSGKKSFTGGLGATNIDSIVTKEITSPTFYGNFVTCESSANDDKVVSVPSMVNFVLKEGVHVFVQFTNINTKSSPTFKINNTDAKSMLLHKREGTSPMPVGTTVYDSWQKGEVVELVYSEGAWWVNKPYYVKEANNANT
ncbi:MAG: hypothetical protein J6W64_06380, partial [Bacilli bacterium]|nr:hypothetical protein [Bacilli bacterium]